MMTTANNPNNTLGSRARAVTLAACPKALETYALARFIGEQRVDDLSG